MAAMCGRSITPTSCGADMTSNQTSSQVERNYEVMQEAIDLDVELREQEKQVALDSVTFDQLLEAMGRWPESRKESFMHTILSDRKGMRWAQHTFLECEVHVIDNAKLSEVA